MQEPLDNLSENARIVHALLEAQEGNAHPEAISERLGERLSPGEVADALRELEAAKRAAFASNGWSILT